MSCKFQHSFLLNSISKQNKKHWTRNYTTYSDNFYQRQHELRHDCPKVWQNGPQQLKILKHWSFLINLGTPPWRPRSLSKIKINEHATACDTLIISCNFNISHFLARPKTWPRQLKIPKSDRSSCIWPLLHADLGRKAN